MLVMRICEYPFTQASLGDSTYRTLLEQPIDFWAPIKAKYRVSDDFICLISSMLQHNPAGRPTMVDLIGSKWMRGETATKE